MEGLDLMMIVEGRELVSLKLQGAELETHMVAEQAISTAHHALMVRLNVEDIIIQDLQVANVDMYICSSAFAACGHAGSICLLYEANLK